MKARSGLIGYFATSSGYLKSDAYKSLTMSSIRRKISAYLSTDDFHPHHIRAYIAMQNSYREMTHSAHSDIPLGAYDDFHSYSDIRLQIGLLYYSLKAYILCYALLYVFVGTLTAIPSSIFPFVQNQLNISNEEMGLLWSAKDICIGISTLFSGFIVDKLHNWGHIYNVLFILLSTISMCSMSVIYNYYLMMLCWITIGLVFGVLTCCIPLYMFRLFHTSEDAAVMLNGCSLIEAISMAAFTPFVDLSQSYFKSYSYSIYLLTAIIVTPIIISLCTLPTPVPTQQQLIQTATLSQIKTKTHSEIEKQERSEKEIEQHSEKKKDIEQSPDTVSFKVIFGFAVLSACLIAFYQSQIVLYGAYISIYSLHFIGSTEKQSLYFVTMYFCGIAAGRIVAHFSFRRYRADNIILFSVTGMFLSALSFVSVHFMFATETVEMAQNVYQILLYIILFNAGMFCAPLYPASMAFLSLICPMNGYLSSALIVGLCVGGSVSAFYIGLLVDMFSAIVIPYCAVIQLLICFVCGVILKIQFNKHKKGSLLFD